MSGEAIAPRIAGGTGIDVTPDGTISTLGGGEVLRTGIFGPVNAGSTAFLDPTYIANPLDTLGFVIPRAGVLGGLHVLARTPPTNPGASDVYTVFVNGVPTPLTVTMTESETCVVDTTHLVSVAPCDRVSVQLVASGATLAADIMVAIEVSPPPP